MSTPNARVPVTTTVTRTWQWYDKDFKSLVQFEQPVTQHDVYKFRGRKFWRGADIGELK